MTSEADDNPINALDSTMKKKQAATLELNAQITEYVQNVKEALDTLVQKISQDKEESADLIESTRRNLEEYKAHTSDGEGKLQSLRDQIATLEEDQTKKQSKIDFFKLKLDESKKQLREQAGMTEEKLAQLDRVEDLEQRLLEATEASEAVNRKFGNLESDLATQTKKADEAEELQKQLDALRAERKEDIAELDASKAALESMTREHDVAKKDLGTTTTGIDEFKKEIAALNEAITHKTFEMRQAEQQHEQALRNAQEERDTISSGMRDQIKTL